MHVRLWPLPPHCKARGFSSPFLHLSTNTRLRHIHMEGGGKGASAQTFGPIHRRRSLLVGSGSQRAGYRAVGGWDGRHENRTAQGYGMRHVCPRRPVPALARGRTRHRRPFGSRNRQVRLAKVRNRGLGSSSASFVFAWEARAGQRVLFSSTSC